MAVEVRRATPSDRDALAAMLSRAFYDDPVMAWFFPDDGRRAARCEVFFRRVILYGPYARAGDVYTTEGLGSAAIWLPPDKWRLGILDQLRFLPAILRILPLRWLASRLAAFNQIEARHPHEPPHWYLSTLGTDPDQQGHGLGSALLADRLRRLDADALPAYLESSKERNVPFYERHGFAVTETVDLPDGPRLWLMWRDPQVPEA
jgi:ribosomal protein S18 acetylase RimI-like enzyme